MESGGVLTMYPSFTLEILTGCTWAQGAKLRTSQATNNEDFRRVPRGNSEGEDCGRA